MNVVKVIRKEIPQWSVGIASIIGTREYQQDYVYCCFAGMDCWGLSVMEWAGWTAERSPAAPQQRRWEKHFPGKNSGCLSRSF